MQKWYCVSCSWPVLPRPTIVTRCKTHSSKFIYKTIHENNVGLKHQRMPLSRFRNFHQKIIIFRRARNASYWKLIKHSIFVKPQSSRSKNNNHLVLRTEQQPSAYSRTSPNVRIKFGLLIKLSTTRPSSADPEAAHTTRNFGVKFATQISPRASWADSW